MIIQRVGRYLHTDLKFKQFFIWPVFDKGTLFAHRFKSEIGTTNEIDAYPIQALTAKAVNPNKKSRNHEMGIVSFVIS